MVDAVLMALSGYDTFVLPSWKSPWKGDKTRFGEPVKAGTGFLASHSTSTLVFATLSLSLFPFHLQPLTYIILPVLCSLHLFSSFFPLEVELS